MTQAQIGLMIEGQAGLNWPRWKQILKTAEETGYQSVFRSDHYIIGKPQDSLELWTSLTYAASHTTKIEFGPLVSPITFRQPMMSVRYATAVDDLSGGRLIFGMGAGWHDDEHTRWGVPFYDFPIRYEMFEDGLEITRLLLQNDGEVSYNGKHFSLNGATLLPRPARAGGPPILIGGSGPKRTLPLVAEYAREWNVVFIDIPTYKDRTETLNRYLAEKGREPSDVKRSVMTRVIYGKTDADVKARLASTDEDADTLIARGCAVGTKQAIIDTLSAWVEAGAERFMFQWTELDDIDGIEAIAADIIPHFHGA